MTMERKRQLALFLAALAALGLIAFAAVQISRWRGAGGTIGGGLAVRRIALAEAPAEVQAAAAKLAPSRVGYALTRGSATYLIISTGAAGERVALAGADRVPGLPQRVHIRLRTGAGGEQLLIARVHGTQVRSDQILLSVDGRQGVIPVLANPDGLSLVTLPVSEHLAVVSPDGGARISGGVLEVAGFARLHTGRVSVQVFSAGKGRVLGESLAAPVAAAYPDWGSFRILVPLTLPAETREGVVLVYDPDSGAKVAIPIRFADK